IVPGNFIAAAADLEKFPPLNAAFYRIAAFSVAGALFGTLRLLYTPSTVFEKLVPILLALATALFAYGKSINNWIRARALSLHGREPQLNSASMLVLLPVSIYVGYFGAGAGILLLAVFSIWHAGDYRAANVIKNLVSAFCAVGSVVLLSFYGVIDWKAGTVLMLGTVVGGWIGGRIARIAPREIMVAVGILIGVALTCIYAWRYWF
ncbi:MAG: sulfite exporter TauE/SafE family protein, partial [Pseudorhodoplanes sp.]